MTPDEDIRNRVLRHLSMRQGNSPGIMMRDLEREFPSINALRLEGHVISAHKDGLLKGNVLRAGATPICPFIYGLTPKGREHVRRLR
jgi:hypothetical protein